MTNYVLLAYAALAAAPLSVAKWVSWASVLCAVLALGTAGAAGRVLWGLDKAHDKELDAARAQLPLVQEIHAKRLGSGASSDRGPRRPGRVILVLYTALAIGAALAIGVNLSRVVP